MNFSSMEYFSVLARERSFTKAAERLHITQQSLSSHIAGMEKELDCRLFVRHVPLELTYAGEVLLRYATDFQKTHTAMRHEFCDISQNQTGKLRVGVAATRGRMIITDTLPLFQEEYPNICVELTEASNDALHQKLTEGEIDLAMADFPAALPDVGLRNFYCEEVMLMAEKTFFASIYADDAKNVQRKFQAGDFSQLADCPLLLGGTDDIDGRIGRNVLKRAGVDRPRVKVSSHNVGTLLMLCVQGMGACFCPENLARATLAKKQLQTLEIFKLGTDARYQIRFGYQEQTYQWSVVEAFMGCARNAYARKRKTRT